MPNRLFELMEKKGKSVQEIADAIGKSSDYIYRIRNPNYKERLNEDIIKPLADALNCYPSELLPLEWQKPELGFDEQIMSNTIKVSLELWKESGREINIDEYVKLVMHIYKVHTKDYDEKKEGPANENNIRKYVRGALGMGMIKNG